MVGWTTVNTLRPIHDGTISIQLAMTRLLGSMILLVSGALVSGAYAQATAPASPSSMPASEDNAGSQKAPPNPDDLPPLNRPGTKVGLVRGVLKQLDPIRDQLVIHPFGGRDVRINFDPRTQLLPANPNAHLAAIPVGSVVSVDTVIDGGKLFALSVRTGPSTGAELNGQVLSYDAAKSRLTVRDPLSPQSVALRMTPSTIVVNQGQPASPQALSPGALVRVWFSPAQNAVNRVEILAERGNSFTFEGRVVAVDLRSRVLSLSNDSDQSVHELAIASLDETSLRLLREGAAVSVQAEFDGQRYNARTVSLVSHQP
jgi:hypothetical protein